MDPEPKKPATWKQILLTIAGGFFLAGTSCYGAVFLALAGKSGFWLPEALIIVTFAGGTIFLVGCVQLLRKFFG